MNKQVAKGTSKKGPLQIARILTNEKILTPAHYWYPKIGKKTGGMSMDVPYSWSDSTVRNILHNKVYLGHTHIHKTTTFYFKVKQLVKVPEDKQIPREGTHAPLVSEEVWEIAQGVRSHKQKPSKKQKEPNLFAGIVYCADCGRSLTTYRESSGAHRIRLKCSNYDKHGKILCTPHCIQEDELIAVVLGNCAASPTMPEPAPGSLPPTFSKRTASRFARKSTPCKKKSPLSSSSWV